MAATKLPAHPSWTPAGDRVTGDMIATRGYLASLAWTDDGCVLTVDTEREVVKWTVEGRRVVSRTLGAAWDRVVVAPFGPGLLIARVREHLEVLREDNLEVVAPNVAACDVDAPALVAGGRLVTLLGKALAVYTRTAAGTLTLTSRTPALADLVTTSSQQGTLALQPDGALIASTWSVPRWLSLDELSVHNVPGALYLMAVDRAGGRAFVQRPDRLAVVSLYDGAVIADGPREVGVVCARFSGPDVLAAFDNRLRCIDAATGAVRWTTEFASNPTRMAESADGSRVAVAFQKRVLVLDRATGALLHDAGLEAPIRRLSVARSPKGATLVATGARTIYTTRRSYALWEMPDLTFRGVHGDLRLATASAGMLHGARVTRDPSESAYHLARVDLQGALPTTTDRAKVEYPLHDLAFGDEGRAALYDAYGAAGRGWTLRHVALRGEAPVETVIATRAKRPNAFQLFSGEHAQVVGWTYPDLLELYDTRAGTTLWSLKGAAKALADIALAPDGAWFVVVTHGSLSRRSTADGAVAWSVKHAKPHADHVACVSSDGARVITAGPHARVTARRASDGAVEAEFRAPGGDVSAIVFGPDGRLFLASSDGHIHALQLP